MPYVEGFGTWPFGEEWLWEAMATSYLPLLDLLDTHPGRLTLSVTPVLCDQLEAPRVPERFMRFIREVRTETHKRDIAQALHADQPDVARAIEQSAQDYQAAGDSFVSRDHDLVAAFAPHVTWTSSATHAVLPLLATNRGIGLQVERGVESFKQRFGDWGGNFWLPECAYAPWLEKFLVRSGVTSVCVELTNHFGKGALQHLQPLKSEPGLRLFPLDRSLMDLVWSDGGYPAHGAYAETHRRTTHAHYGWSIDGEPYNKERAYAQAWRDAADFVAAVERRIADGGLCVCAFDTELFGHWWPEGVEWLRAVMQIAFDRCLDLVTLKPDCFDGDFVSIRDPLPVSTWGTGCDLRTWSSPPASRLAWRQRRAELDLMTQQTVPAAAIDELLALQASDWAFLVNRETAGLYPQQRSDGHLAALREIVDVGAR